MKSSHSIEKVISDCLRLNLVVLDDGNYRLTKLGILFAEAGVEERQKLFGHQAKDFEIFRRFLDVVESSGIEGISSKEAASRALGNTSIELAELTITKLGNILANWGEYSNLIVRERRICYSWRNSPQMWLF